MKRVIFLVDMNAFFISCETTRRPELAGVPAAVAGDPAHRSGIILAANYEARKFGVRTTMVLHEARRLCPNLVLVPPDHAFYEEKSKEVMDLLSRFSPLVEPNSIDEAWLDMTGCGHLSGTPLQAAESIMAGIRGELGLWCSIGISENKYLAKMASDMKKPMGITELWLSDLADKMWPKPVGDLLGAGKKTVAKLNLLGIRTIGDLARMDPALLFKRFGRGGIDLQQHAWGNDDSPVQLPDADEMKSIGKSTTLNSDAESLEEIRPVLMQLTEEVAASARQHGKKGHVVQISIKYADFVSVTRQTTLSATNATDEILRAGLSLLEKHWESGRPVRLIGISLSGFDEEAGQVSLFDLQELKEFGAGKTIRSLAGDGVKSGDVTAGQRVILRRQRAEALDSALDALRERYGDQSVQRASLIGVEKPKRHGGPGHKETDS